MQDRTELQREFLEECYKRYEKGECPVNAMAVADELYGEDENVRLASLCNIFRECFEKGWILASLGKNEVRFTEAGLKFIGKDV